MEIIFPITYNRKIMKKIYALLFVSLLLFIGYSCEDGSLSHGDVYIPDPVEESDEMMVLRQSLQQRLL